MEKFSNILKELLEEKGFDEQTFANKVGVTGATVSRWLNNKMSIKLFTAIKIADMFNCSLDYLFGRSVNFSNEKYRKCPPVNEQLHKVLNEANLTQYRLIKNKVLSANTINNLLNRGSDVQIESLMKLADYLDVSLDYLVGREK